MVTNGFEGTQAHMLTWRPFLGEPEEREGSPAQMVGEACLDTYTFSVCTFTVSKAQNGRMETRGKGLLFGLAVSFVNAPKGCTWVPKLVSDRLMSIRLCGWIRFEKYRRESANFPEDNVTPRHEGPVT